MYNWYWQTRTQKGIAHHIVKVIQCGILSSHVPSEDYGGLCEKYAELKTTLINLQSETFDAWR